MDKAISRRDFLKGAGAFGVGAAALGVFGVNAFAASEDPDAVSSASVEEESGGSSREASGEINPVTTDERVFGYAGPGDWLGQKPEIPAVSKTLECDVAVVGLGHSGTQAFLAAAEKGAKVIAVENQPEDTHAWYGEDFARSSGSVAWTDTFTGLTLSCKMRSISRSERFVSVM